MDALIAKLTDPLAAVLLAGCSALAAAVGVLWRHVGGMHRQQVDISNRSIEVQTRLTTTLDGMSTKLDNAAQVDARMVEALAELKATIRKTA